MLAKYVIILSVYLNSGDIFLIFLELCECGWHHDWRESGEWKNGIGAISLLIRNEYLYLGLVSSL